MKPRLLDLFAGAGGAAKGYQRAGFYVIGVDIKPQPNYCGDEFAQLDALTLMEGLLALRDSLSSGGWFAGQQFGLQTLAAIHASPPCQAYSTANNIHGRTDHPELIPQTRELLQATGLPYVIENVPGAPLENPITLCGLTFGLNVKRHRLFECSFPVMTYPCAGHAGDWLLVFGHTVLERGTVVGKAPGGGNKIKRKHTTTQRGREAMGIDWMTRDELSQAIPPAMTEHIGSYLMAEVNRRRGVAA